MKTIKIFLLVIILSVIFEASNSFAGTMNNSDSDYRWRPRHRVIYVHHRPVVRRPVVYVVRPRWHRRHYVRRVFRY